MKAVREEVRLEWRIAWAQVGLLILSLARIWYLSSNCAGIWNMTERSMYLQKQWSIAWSEPRNEYNYIWMLKKLSVEVLFMTVVQGKLFSDLLGMTKQYEFGMGFDKAKSGKRQWRITWELMVLWLLVFGALEMEQVASVIDEFDNMKSNVWSEMNRTIGSISNESIEVDDDMKLYLNKVILSVVSAISKDEPGRQRRVILLTVFKFSEGRVNQGTIGKTHYDNGMIKFGETLLRHKSVESSRVDKEISAVVKEQHRGRKVRQPARASVDECGSFLCIEQCKIWNQSL